LSFLILFRIIALYLDSHFAHAIILEQFDAFEIGTIFDHLSMSLIPTQWPDKIGSYAYDFSMLYIISQNLNIIEDKVLYMPDNILAYGSLSYLLFYLFAKIKIFASLVIYRIIANSLLIISVFIACHYSFSKLPKQYWKFITSALVAFFLLLISTPFYYFNVSGNIEIYLFALCLLALIFDKRPLLSTILFSCAAAVKYYPAIFFLIFIKRRQYNYFLLSGLLTVILFFCPMFFLKDGFGENLFNLKNEILTASRLCHLNAEVFCRDGGLSIAMGIYNLSLPLEIKDRIFELSVVAIILSGLIAFFKIKQDSVALIPLITTFCLITQVSVFYKLSYLLIPILLDRSNQFKMGKTIIYILIALALSPIPFYLGISISGVKGDFSLILILIHIAALTYAINNTEGTSSEPKKRGIIKKSRFVTAPFFQKI